MVNEDWQQGSGLAVRLPVKVVRELDLRQGEDVEVFAADGKIVVRIKDKGELILEKA